MMQGKAVSFKEVESPLLVAHGKISILRLTDERLRSREPLGTIDGDATGVKMPKKHNSSLPIQERRI